MLSSTTGQSDTGVDLRLRGGLVQSWYVTSGQVFNLGKCVSGQIQLHASLVMGFSMSTSVGGQFAGCAAASVDCRLTCRLMASTLR